MFRRPPGGYDSESVPAFGVEHVENVGGNPAYNHETFFAIVLPVVKKLNGKRILEDFSGKLKSHSVPVEVVRCLGLVPLEFQSHSTGFQ